MQHSPSHEQPSPVAHLIQPHSVALILEDGDFTIRRVSANAASLLEDSPESLLGRSFNTLLDEAAIDDFRDAQDNLEQSGERLTPQYVPLTLISGQALEGWLHHSSEAWILELEAAPQALSPARSTTRALQQFRSQVSQLKRSATEQELLQSSASAVQSFTKLERTLIYRFADDGSGTVVAEANQPTHSCETTPAYLGIRFPATDIPAFSRQQYRQGKLRYVPDLLAEPVECVPPFETPEQIAEAGDLFQNSLFHAVDSCCITYHSNINVRAFLVIPLMRQEELWGLMVCHHSSPVTLPASVRLDCAWLGEILAAELARKESQTALIERERLKTHQSEFLAAIAQSDNFIQGLIEPELRLLGFTNAQGAVIFFENQTTAVGAAPPREFLDELYDWAITQVDESTYDTDRLPQVYAPAEPYKDIASGLLFLLISSARRYAIAWFRPEVLQTATWAGNPADSYTPDENGNLTLCPRASFAQWQETVRFTSSPWHPWEVSSALDLRNAIVGIVLRKADEITEINRDLERSNQELASFAYAASHDLKEPLRGINNYARLLIKENQDSLDEKAIKRLNTLTKLTRRMGRLIDALLRFSRMGQTELNLRALDLNLLIARVVEMQELSRPEAPLDIWIPRPLPTVQADPILLSEVYNNLLSNALKYNTSETPWVEVGYYNSEEITDMPHLPNTLKAPVLYVRDNGIGIPEQHWQKIFELFRRLHSQKKYGGGTGAGLTITKKIIERHGGEINVFSSTEGTTFYWTLG